jgi:pyridinium-3,5-bisthiocarboxylic acid mononucleotide nickel chelatase
VQQKLLDAGALDAFGVPVQMKKGRPGLVFTVLAAPADAERMARILLTETTTLGVRMRREQRRVLERTHVTVESCWGPIRVKLGHLHGEVVNCAPEFEDCRRIAEAAGVPLKSVMQEAMRLYGELPGRAADAGHAAALDAGTSDTKSFFS